MSEQMMAAAASGGRRRATHTRSGAATSIDLWAEFVSPLYLLQKGNHSLNHVSLASPAHLFSSEVALRLGKQCIVDLFELIGFITGPATNGSVAWVLEELYVRAEKVERWEGVWGETRSKKFQDHFHALITW